MFIDKLLKRIIELKNPSVLGLDPDVEKFPKFIKEEFLGENVIKTADNIKNAIEFFNKCIIDAVYDIIPAVKFQAAYYEMYGPKGMEALLNSVEYARSKGMIIIIDAKRNDIGTTAKAYSNAYIGRSNIMGVEMPIYDADALTVNAYLGSDGINPFLEDCEKYDKGIFVLVKTSNPSSGEFQDIETENSKELYVRVGEKVEEWGKKIIGEYGYSSVGAVVGATYPKQLKELREKMQHTLFLVPGYGAQGGKAEDIKLAYDENGLGALVNSSRGLMYAYKSEKWKEKYSEEEFALAARAEAIDMKNNLWRE